jgi:transcriptional regulator with XRE-family HTH domain
MQRNHDIYVTGTDGTNGKGTGGVAGHFGKQVRRDRLARGWSIAELAQRTGLNAAHLSRIEGGRRPPTVRIADALDRVFPDRRGWYLQWLDDIRTAPEIPAEFRSWGDFEDQTATLRAWTPTIIDGLVQVADYAAALIATEPGITSATADGRLKARMARQQRLLDRERPPRVTLLVDELSLFRLVGSAEVMAAQMRAWPMPPECRPSRSRSCPRSPTPASRRPTCSPTMPSGASTWPPGASTPRRISSRT